MKSNRMPIDTGACCGGEDWMARAAEAVGWRRSSYLCPSIRVCWNVVTMRPINLVKLIPLSSSLRRCLRVPPKTWLLNWAKPNFGRRQLNSDENVDSRLLMNGFYAPAVWRNPYLRPRMHHRCLTGGILLFDKPSRLVSFDLSCPHSSCVVRLVARPGVNLLLISACRGSAE